MKSAFLVLVLLVHAPLAAQASGRPDLNDPSSVYRSMSDATLESMEATGDGEAAWVLAMRLALTDLDSGKRHALLAATYLDSGWPLVSFVEQFLSGDRHTAVPYLLYALEVGDRDVRRSAGDWLDALRVSDRERDARAGDVALIRAYVQSIATQGTRR